MRVIAGSAKGRRLTAPKGVDIRPTADRVKESLFNIISDEVIDAVVLDTFAGTGNLGIEALSRGASEAVFIDQSSRAIDTIRKNLDITGFSSNAVIIKAPADKAARKLADEGRTFDLIFLDPPYRISVSFLDAILLLVASHMLRPNGLLVLEHDAKREARAIHGLVLVTTRVYGDTAVSMYRKEG